MASRKDMQDMLGLPGDAVTTTTTAAAAKAPPIPKPKAKPTFPKPRMSGINREVAALMGERAPPIAILDENKLYKSKRVKSLGPAKPWVRVPFVNPARSDGLILKHWRRKPVNRPNVGGEEGGGAAAAEERMEVDGAAQDVPVETDYEFAKYNFQIPGPQYTDEQYDLYLRSDDWSKEETDYLIGLVKEYYQRWAIIADRYDWQPPTKTENTQGDSTALTLASAAPKPRTMEDMKARYYSICAKCMEFQTPISNMDAAEFALHETLSRFDPVLETNRKKLATALLSRSLDEIKEEEFLLAELQRINISAVRLDAERAEIRARLEIPQTSTPQNQNQNGANGANGANGTTTTTASTTHHFQSSQALQQLFQQLFQQDRSRKRAAGPNNASRLSLNANDLIGSPANGAAGNTHGHRDSITSGAGGASTKKGGSSAAAAAAAGGGAGSGGTSSATPSGPIRQLPQRAEYRFGITTHERLTSGVTFRTDKVLKLRQAKSQVQTQKIAGVLAELGVPEAIALPTNKVTHAFEGLIGKVGRLLDLRKVREKEEAEVKVLEAERERVEAEKRGKEGEAEGADGAEKEGEGKVAAEPGTKKEEGEQGGDTTDAPRPADQDPAPPPPQPPTTSTAAAAAETSTPGDDAGAAAAGQAGQKRSASVLSDGSAAGGKRMRK